VPEVRRGWMVSVATVVQPLVEHLRPSGSRARELLEPLGRLVGWAGFRFRSCAGLFYEVLKKTITPAPLLSNPHRRLEKTVLRC
jgi:hypothetical protein